MQSFSALVLGFYFISFCFADIILIQSSKICPIEEFDESVKKVQEEKNYVLKVYK